MKVNIEYNYWLNIFLLHNPETHDVVGSMYFEYDPDSPGYGLTGKIIAGSYTAWFNKSLEIIGPIITRPDEDAPREKAVRRAIDLAIMGVIDKVLLEMLVEANWDRHYIYLSSMVEDMVEYWMKRDSNGMGV